MYCIGLDIGGANIKAADNYGNALSVEFPMWQKPDQLQAELQSVLNRFDRYKEEGPKVLAVTMTGELADCFERKSDGVKHIVDAVLTAAKETPAFFWQTPGEFVDAETAVEFPKLTAAANWHALATWAGRMVPDGCGLLVDIGSTTTDIIPIQNGIPMPTGRTDLERLASQELVYLGGKRTPLCAVHQVMKLNGEMFHPAAEFFATTHDLFLLTGDFPEQPENNSTADNRPATREYAARRIARMLCSDESEISLQDVELITCQYVARIEQQLSHAMERVASRLPEPASTILISGEGHFLARKIIQNSPPFESSVVIVMEKMLGEHASSAACAYALAQLGSERLRLID